MYACVCVALAFREWLGGEAKINAYCHQMAVEGGKYLARELGTEVMDKTGELTLNMASVIPMRRAVILTVDGADECPPSPSRGG